MNLLVVRTTPESTELQTRNRAGKSSFVELVHFLTGGNADPESLFRQPELADEWFSLELDVGGLQTTVTRSGREPNRLRVEEFSRGWPAVPQPSLDGSELSNNEWRLVLGQEWFGIPTRDERRHAPTSRSLLGYFARRAPGGFISPFKHHPLQSRGEMQVDLSLLLGLDWSIPADLQVVRDQESSLRALRKATQSGAIPGPLMASGAIRSQLAVAESRAARTRASVDSFQVLDEYGDLEREASRLTRQLNEAADQNTMDLRLEARLEEAFALEVATPDPTVVSQLYEEAGVVLPEVTLRRLEDVRDFHQSVVTNRRSYLEQEAEAVTSRLAERRSAMAAWDGRRAEIMVLLQTHGALSHFSELQAELSRLEAQSEELRQQYAAAERLESFRAELDLERSQITRRLRRDHAERDAFLRDAIVTFEEVSSSLYEEAGRLEIEEGTNGPEFTVRIQGDRSAGVRNMEIFALDMTVMKLCAARGIGPGFLIHDSHLFDGVDERQVGHAMAVAARLSQELGFQYIATMNSDDLPTTLPSEFELDTHILPVELTDAREDGGLFGFRF